MDPRTEQSAESTESTTDEVLGVRSGTGAPIFEHGPTTRIRRNPTRAVARVSWESGPRAIFGQVVDVSMTGCLLKTESTIETGTRLQMTVTLVGDSDEIDVDALVRRTDTVDGRQAYGLEFCADTSDQKRAAKTLYSKTARG